MHLPSHRGVTPHSPTNPAITVTGRSAVVKSAVIEPEWRRGFVLRDSLSVAGDRRQRRRLSINGPFGTESRRRPYRGKNVAGSAVVGQQTGMPPACVRFVADEPALKAELFRSSSSAAPTAAGAER